MMHACIQFGNHGIDNAQMHDQTREIIAKLMAHKRWNEPTLAEKSGVNQSTINRFLSGKTDEASFQTIQGIAHALGVTVSQLIGEVPVEADDKIQRVVLLMQAMPEYKKDVLVAAGDALAQPGLHPGGGKAA